MPRGEQTYGAAEEEFGSRPCPPRPRTSGLAAGVGLPFEAPGGLALPVRPWRQPLSPGCPLPVSWREQCSPSWRKSLSIRRPGSPLPHEQKRVLLLESVGWPDPARRQRLPAEGRRGLGLASPSCPSVASRPRRDARLRCVSEAFGGGPRRREVFRVLAGGAAAARTRETTTRAPHPAPLEASPWESLR